MDSFTVRAVKAKAIKKQRKIQNVTNMLRLLEILVVLAVLSRVSVQLPVSLKGSGECIKDFLLVLASPRFVFVVGNVIVIVLFAKSGHLPGGVKKSDLYEQFVEDCSVSSSENRVTQNDELEAIVKENRSGSATSMIVKSYERSQSENLTSYRMPVKELRRSVTENLTKKKKEKKKNKGGDQFPEDNLSSEEFKSTIEAFIERQKRFRRDEENSVIV
ncbi:hypothetical protein LINGRAHAP2_LOCUS25649 [Linum grandiflorum]